MVYFEGFTAKYWWNFGLPGRADNGLCSHSKYFMNAGHDLIDVPH